MAVRMKALRTVYTPWNRTEYRQGDEFTAPNRADAERLVRRNRAVIVEGKAPNPTDLPPASAPKTDQPSDQAGDHPSFQEPEADPATKPRSRRGRYNRTDMTAEE